MSDFNPEMEAHLNELATICCERLEGGRDHAGGRSALLLKSLLMSGYVRRESGSFQAELERRVKDRCFECAMHRGAALESLSGELSAKLRELARWESTSPSDNSPPKAANISSATDA